jgi:hypothetical protein
VYSMPSARTADAHRLIRVTFVCRQRLVRKLAHATALLSDGRCDPPIDTVVELALDSFLALIHDA